MFPLIPCDLEEALQPAARKRRARAELISDVESLVYEAPGRLCQHLQLGHPNRTQLVKSPKKIFSFSATVSTE